MHPDFVNTYSSHYVSVDGVMYTTDSPRVNAADLCVFVILRNPGPTFYYPDEVRVDSRNWPWTYLSMQVWRDRKGISIRVISKSDDDLWGVALLQSLLRGGLAKPSRMRGDMLRSAYASHCKWNCSHGKVWKRRWRRSCHSLHATHLEAECCLTGESGSSACTLGRLAQGRARRSRLGLSML